MKNKIKKSNVCKNINKENLLLDCISPDIVFSFFNSNLSTMICITEIDSEKNNTEIPLFLRFTHGLPLLWCLCRFKKCKVGINLCLVF